MLKKIALLPKLLIGLALLLLVGWSASGSAELMKGSGTSQQRAPDGEWVTTGRADNRQEYCDTYFKNTLCAEWCEGLEGRPTGSLCCISPDAVGFPGSRADCEHPIW